MRVLIVDDEQPALDVMELLLGEDERVRVVGAFSYPNEALAAAADLKPDAVFVDIQMPGTDGLALAEQLKELDEEMEIIFVTAYQNHALEAFQLNALDYILKPVHPSLLSKTIDRLLKRKGISSPKQPESKEDNRGRSLTAASIDPSIGEAAPENADADSLPRISCLGGFRMYSPGIPAKPIKWRTSKTEELMAYLFLKKGHNIPKWEIIDKIWPDSTEEQAHSHLHTTLYKVRRTLKDAGIEAHIAFINSCYKLSLQPVVCDLDLLEQQAKTAALTDDRSAAEHERFLASHQGDLFEGLDYAWSESFREYYRGLFTDMSRRLASYWIERENYTAAASAINRALSKSTLDENSHELQLQIHFLRKDRTALVKQYNKLTELLRTELGLAPRESTRRLYEKMLEQL
ncbi:Two-component response regulator, SAPR family, consists of REC, wHTH and BTAD domains [Paenibacillus sp. UNCCL117]|uniref:response regulator n=1 Tax=unclassified Paenibacillus TaxID=185978 RepID=UPI0008852371|nr:MULTISPECIES: response regulator [unclassified Paenibacillus]SDE46870.1 Two-component response regulator, SAPR family, consists of REC, wHTH and BTAD domains [Paenibacillus sp. cl123]SFW65781.1 Two-component response regulator, SAPR family, consists of REC, wHTH and BTAD domains [Paenibacillus sp. UNCCL117]